jgi:hypothetical protein
MNALLVRMRGTWTRVSTWIDARRIAVTCFLAALAVYGIESIAWPLTGGRDSTTYLMYYVDMWHAHPAYPALMLYRTPLAPLVYGPLLQLGGPLLAEAGMAVLFAVSVSAFALAALEFGPAASVLTAVAVLAYPGYGALFHQVSSDPIFAFVFSLWTLATVRVLRRPRVRGFVVCGVLLLALVLARPGSQTLLVFALAPLLLSTSWRRRLLYTATFAVSAAVLLTAWAGYNDARYGSFVVARAGWADVPFYRVFHMEKIVRPENGPASRELADDVRRDLLGRPPYTQQGVTTVDQFFRLASDRMWSDAVVVVDHEWGWHSDYAVLRTVSIEAIDRHLHLYARDVAGAVWDELRYPYQWSAPVSARAAVVRARTSPIHASGPGDLGGRYWWLASTPSGKAPVAARVARLDREVNTLQDDIPGRSGSATLARILNAISRGFPWAAMWLFASFVALVWRRPSGWVALVVTAALALAVIVGTMLGNPQALEYGLPFQPAFVLCCMAALAGRRDATRAGLEKPVAYDVPLRRTT